MSERKLSSVSTVTTLAHSSVVDRIQFFFDLIELTAEDILNVSPRYWEFHTDPILIMDGSVGTLLTIHYNLTVGTLAMFAQGRPDVQSSLQRMLTFQTSCVPEQRLSLAGTSNNLS